jgi:hypothetical protein
MGDSKTTARANKRRKLVLTPAFDNLPHEHRLPQINLQVVTVSDGPCMWQLTVWF